MNSIINLFIGDVDLVFKDSPSRIFPFPPSRKNRRLLSLFVDRFFFLFFSIAETKGKYLTLLIFDNLLISWAALAVVERYARFRIDAVFFLSKSSLLVVSCLCPDHDRRAARWRSHDYLHNCCSYGVRLRGSPCDVLVVDFLCRPPFLHRVHINFFLSQFPCHDYDGLWSLWHHYLRLTTAASRHVRAAARRHLRSAPARRYLRPASAGTPTYLSSVFLLFVDDISIHFPIKLMADVDISFLL